MRILHVSDIHVPVPVSVIPKRDWLSKRAMGGLNYLLHRGPRFADAELKMAHLATFAEAENVDLVICTGDLTVLGTEPEHLVARRAIEPLAKRPAGFLAVPGNHDVYLKDSVEAGRFERHFGDLIVAREGELMSSLATDGLYPRVWRMKDVAVIAIESARPNPQPWRSSGRVPAAQLRGLHTALHHPSLRAHFKLVITHYAPRLWDGRPDSPSHGLDNADELLEVLRPHARTSLLHGHIHRRYALTLPGIGPTILCAGSGTERGHSGGWILEIDATQSLAHGYQHDGQRYARTGDSVVLA
jgi:3',5'-cyclic AMP phosphodiesterase CpdA